MIGNAVPVRIANILAKKIWDDLSGLKTTEKLQVKRQKLMSNAIENSVIDVM